MDGRSRLICDECGTPYDAPTDEVNDPCLEPGCRDGVLREADRVVLADGTRLPFSEADLAFEAAFSEAFGAAVADLCGPVPLPDDEARALADAFTLPADAAVLAEVDDADLFGLADVQDEEDGL